MKNIFLSIVFILFLSCSLPANAQLLDDDIASTDNDSLFDEMFDDFSETEKDINKVKTFDDAVDVLSNDIKQRTDVEEVIVPAEQLTPVEGQMFIGIKKDSFKLYTDMSGRSRCFFTAVLKSELNKDIKTLALNLVYPKRIFAFVFKDIPAGQSQFRNINSAGDICYNMAGITPDITLHKCKIRGAIASDCVKYIKWSDDLE